MTFHQFVYDVGFLVVSALGLLLLLSPYIYYLKKKDFKERQWNKKFIKMVEETDPVIKNRLREELGIDNLNKEEK